MRFADCHPDREYVAKGFCSSCYQKQHPNKRTISTRDKNLRSFYGITEAQYNELLEKQNGVCAVCGKKQKEKRPLFVDHNHACCPGVRSCGKCIRGIVCTGCNTLIGFLESPNAPKAQIYISSFNGGLTEPGIVSAC
jgi:hypothetical protein